MAIIELPQPRQQLHILLTIQHHLLCHGPHIKHLIKKYNVAKLPYGKFRSKINADPRTTKKIFNFQFPIFIEYAAQAKNSAKWHRVHKSTSNDKILKSPNSIELQSSSLSHFLP
jgi:hypothetical protein